MKSLENKCECGTRLQVGDQFCANCGASREDIKMAGAYLEARGLW